MTLEVDMLLRRISQLEDLVDQALTDVKSLASFDQTPKHFDEQVDLQPLEKELYDILESLFHSGAQVKDLLEHCTLTSQKCDKEVVKKAATAIEDCFDRYKICQTRIENCRERIKAVEERPSEMGVDEHPDADEGLMDHDAAIPDPRTRAHCLPKQSFVPSNLDKSAEPYSISNGNQARDRTGQPESTEHATGSHTASRSTRSASMPIESKASSQLHDPTPAGSSPTLSPLSSVDSTSSSPALPPMDDALLPISAPWPTSPLGSEAGDLGLPLMDNALSEDISPANWLDDLEDDSDMVPISQTGLTIQTRNGYTDPADVFACKASSSRGYGATSLAKRVKREERGTLSEFTKFPYLPPEVQGRIYMWALVSKRPIAPRLCSKSKEKAQYRKIQFHDGNQAEHNAVYKTLAITRVSRQVRAESLKVFYNKNTFELSADISTFLDHLTHLRRFGMVHHISIPVFFYRFRDEMLRGVTKYVNMHEKHKARTRDMRYSRKILVSDPMYKAHGWEPWGIFFLIYKLCTPISTTNAAKATEEEDWHTFTHQFALHVSCKEVITRYPMFAYVEKVAIALGIKLLFVEGAPITWLGRNRAQGLQFHWFRRFQGEVNGSASAKKEKEDEPRSLSPEENKELRIAMENMRKVFESTEAPLSHTGHWSRTPCNERWLTLNWYKVDSMFRQDPEEDLDDEEEYDEVDYARYDY